MSEVKVNKISPRTNCGTVTVGDAGDSVTVTAGVPVTVNGDLKSNALKAVDGGSIISQCGTTITLGASGDTINLAAGASQTGFGRTGTVDWDTTAKTASFTAVSGNGYFVNTTSGAVTMTLPATPSAGDIVSVKDYAYTFATNNLIVNRNGSPIGGASGVNTINYSTNGDFLTFIYVDGTRGWVLTNDSTNIDSAANPFIVATGGTITCCGDYKIHTFTGPGTFCVSCSGTPAGSTTVDYLVIAGGGGGGSGNIGGGGGAGGFRESKATGAPWTSSPLATSTSLPVSVQGYSVTVGGGGSANVAGSNSIFSSITSTGGGEGGQGTCGPVEAGGSGGSGGGGSSFGDPFGPGGAGNTPPVSPPQGNSGGRGVGGTGSFSTAGGGGGAGGSGSDGSPTAAGPGGNGITTSINGSPVTRAGGGGGASDNRPDGSGGPGGGGSAPGGSGTTNTGSGGGGGSGSGGSGIVIIRYKFQ